MSTRIASEVATSTEDKHLSIWYLYSDSMHINYEQVVLSSSGKVGRELIGQTMGQCHIDFEQNDAGDDGDIYSTESYVLDNEIKHM